MRDFTGNEIRAGDEIVLATKFGSHGVGLVRRHVKAVFVDHILVHADPQEPLDKRQIGRVTSTDKAIVITSKFGKEAA